MEAQEEVFSMKARPEVPFSDLLGTTGQKASAAVHGPYAIGWKAPV